MHAKVTMSYPTPDVWCPRLQQLVRSIVSRQDIIRAQSNNSQQILHNILSRLQWTAQSNKSLAAISQDLQQTMTIFKQTIDLDSAAVKQVLDMGQSILDFEALRQQQARGVEHNGVKVLPIVRDLKTLIAHSNSVAQEILSLENQLSPELKAYAPDGHISHSWIHGQHASLPIQLEQSLEEQTRSSIELEAHAKSLAAVTQDVNETAAELSNLFGELTELLKAVSALGDATAAAAKLDVENYASLVADLLNSVSEFVTLGSSSSTLPLKVADSDDVVDAISTLKKSIETQTTSISELLAAVQQKLEVLQQSSALGIDEVVDQASIFPAHVVTRTSTPPVDVKTGMPPHPTPSSARAKRGRQQQQNTFALSIIRRIRHKLEGRDEISRKRLPVTEQVDSTITQAVSKSNLAAMFEGWSSWV
jgi:hypothetical protein